MTNSMTEALSRFSQRLPRPVREHEILRVTGAISANSVKTAIPEILKWAQKRAGGQLPPEAWSHDSFDYLSGGRNSSGVRVRTDDADIWAIRADDPDKEVPGRIWTSEVVVGAFSGQPAKFSVRQLVSTSEDSLIVEPHTPGFVQQVADQCVVMCGSHQISAEAQVFETGSEVDELLAHLVDPSRQLPTFVFTLAEGQRELPTVDIAAFGRAVLGLGHVVLAHHEVTWELTRAVGKMRSVFGGGARVYLPGFTESADPYTHRLVLANQLEVKDGAERVTRWLRQLAAGESIRRAKLGRDVLPFAEIRSASLKFRQQALRNEDASESDQLATANERIALLEKQVVSLAQEQDYYVTEHEQERERADAAEAQMQRGAYRIQQLTEELKKRGDDPDQSVELPTGWQELVEWCDQHLAGRLVLTPNAARGVRKPLYEDVETTGRCLLWLATQCRDQRIGGGGASLNNMPVLDGVQNASCGSDTYEFDWSGRRFSADWHIKNGGNTRDPSRCLRIYYCFDDQTQQIIVSDLPAHRRTEAS